MNEPIYCSTCGNRIGLGYRTNNEGDQFCGERCKDRAEKENRALDALIAMALHPDSEAITAKVFEKMKEKEGQ